MEKIQNTKALDEEKIINEQAEILAKQGFISPVEAAYYKKNASKLLPTWKQKEYQNSEKLLKSYRDLYWAISDNMSCILKENDIPCERSALEASAALRKNIDSILAEISDAVGLERDISQIQSAARSAQFSMQLLSRAEEAVEHLKSYYENGPLLSEVLFQTYIGNDFLIKKAEKNDESYSIYDFLHMKKTRYYKAKNKALQLFSKRLWRGIGYDINEYVRFSIIMEQQHKTMEENDQDN